MSTAVTSTPTPASARRQTVLTAIAAGARRQSDILAACDYPAFAVRAELVALASAGHVSRTAFGRYELTDAGRRHRLELARAAEPAAPAAEEPDPSSASVEQLWQHRVARHILPGSTLSAAEHRPGVDEYLLQLKPGAQTVNDARSSRDRIAAGLERPVEQVIIESHPSQIQSRARLLLVGDDSPLYRPLEHPGTTAFNPVTGELTIGAYADHEPALWQLWTAGGTVHSLVSGGDLSGVTTVLHGVLAAVAGSDLVDARAIDLAGVSGLSAAGQPTAVTRDEAMDLLTDTLKIIYGRGGGPATACPPSTERKLLLLVLADLHLLMADRHLADLVHRIQRCSRKTGVAIVAEAKYLSLNVFGHQPELRAELTNGNLALLRSTRDQPSALAQRLHLDSSTLPKHWHNGVSTAGVGYTNRRNAAFRTFHTPVAW